MNDKENQAWRRKRRRQRRLIMIVGFLLLSIGMAWFFESQATTTVIVARHADPSVLIPVDPGLSPQGERRALDLARMLGEVDVIRGVDAIFVAPYRRTIETSVPLATRNDVPVHTIENPEDVESLVLRILAEYKGDIVLVITEAELMQPLIAEMHGSKRLHDFADNEFDNLYIVSIPWFGKVKTLRLHYGAPFVPKM